MYNKKEWVNDEIITKEALNNMENGIADLDAKMNDVATKKELQDMENTVKALQAEIDADVKVEADRAAAEEAELQGEIDAVEERMTGAEGRLDVLEQSTEQAAQDMENGIADLDNRINDLEDNKIDVSKIQNYKLTNDDGSVNYITTDGLDIFDLAPGIYACIASRFVNPPVPNDVGYVEVFVTQDSNNSGNYIRKTVTVHYIYRERTFISYIHNDYGRGRWIEITEPCSIPHSINIESEKVLLYNKIRDCQTATSKNIGFIADTHYNKDSRGINGRNGLDHIKDCVSLCGSGMADLIVHGGDIIQGGYNATHQMLQMHHMDTNYAMLQSNVPIFPCKGNHDAGLVKAQNENVTDKSYDSLYITNLEFNKLVTSRFVNKYGFKGDDNNAAYTYAYYDFEDVKLRCIMLDTEDLLKEQITDQNGNIVLDEEDGSMVFRIGQEQMDWFTDTALSFPDKEGWSVLLFSHMGIQSPYTEDYSRVKNGDYVHNILRALNEHMGFAATKDNYENLITEVSCDFTGTNHKVLGCICGHYHDDRLIVADGIPYITCKQSRCQFDEHNDITDTNNYRELFNPNYEDAWTIFTVDVDAKTITLSRFGSGKNFEQVIDLNNITDTVFPEAEE